MNKIVLLLFLISTQVMSDDLPENSVLPARAELLTHFQNMDIVKKSEWQQGKVVEGQPVLSARYGEDLYFINNDAVISMSLTKGADGYKEAGHAASKCLNIAYAVTNKKSSNIKNAVMEIIEEAAGHESGSSGDIVDGYWFTVDIKNIERHPLLKCEVKGFTRWD